MAVKVEIWSDVVCPWCYIGKRRFEQALVSFDHRDEVEVVWRAFQLDPDAPPERERDYAGHLASKYGVSRAEGQAMIDRMTATARGVGLAFRFDLARPGNTFDAHRLIHLAAERDRQGAMVERLFSATFEGGQPIGHRDALVGLAVEAGLEPGEARAALESGAYADAVLSDRRQAAAFGITGVPFFVIDRTYGIAGAQSADVHHDVLDQAWAEASSVDGDDQGAPSPALEV